MSHVSFTPFLVQNALSDTMNIEQEKSRWRCPVCYVQWPPLEVSDIPAEVCLEKANQQPHSHGKRRRTRSTRIQPGLFETMKLPCTTSQANVSTGHHFTLATQVSRSSNPTCSICDSISRKKQMIWSGNFWCSLPIHNNPSRTMLKLHPSAFHFQDRFTWKFTMTPRFSEWKFKASLKWQNFKSPEHSAKLLHGCQSLQKSTR